MKLSISKIKLFKACRRAYEFKYIYGLKPVQTADALVTGTGYHTKLEQLYKEGVIDTSDHSKESAMAVAYMKYIYPNFKVRASEEWTEYKLNDEDSLIGRVDGIAEDGCLVEHKTTSLNPMEYEFNLQRDEQILAYMLMTGTRQVYYTVCVKPTIRQKKNETDEEFYNRMVEWYDTDTDQKIGYFIVTRTDEEVEEFRISLEKMFAEMKNTDNLYRNTTYCNCWGRTCEYASICMNYDPNQEYVGFVKES